MRSGAKGRVRKESIARRITYALARAIEHSRQQDRGDVSCQWKSGLDESRQAVAEYDERLAPTKAITHTAGENPEEGIGCLGQSLN